jgi:hypothetical protein
MTLPSYGVFGHAVVADRPLPRCRPLARCSGTITVTIADGDPFDAPHDVLQVTCNGDDEPELIVARAADALLIEARGAGSARIESREGLILSRVLGDDDSWEDRLLNLFVPVLLADRGELVLHGAAIQTPAGAVLLCGPSGRGKSTLAAALGSLGMPVLTEDAARLTTSAGSHLLWPGPRGVRLRARTAAALGIDQTSEVRGKDMVLPSGREISEPRALAAVVVLAERAGEMLQMRRLTAAEALPELFANQFRLDPERWPVMFDRAGELAEQVACWAVRLPDDLGVAREVARQLVDQLVAVTAAA